MSGLLQVVQDIGRVEVQPTLDTPDIFNEIMLLIHTCSKSEIKSVDALSTVTILAIIAVSMLQPMGAGAALP